MPRKSRGNSTSSCSTTPNLSTPVSEQPEVLISPVSELPEELTCPVCRDIINSPMLLSCCGVHICGRCVRKIRESPLETGNHCPYCKKEFNTMQNQAIQRRVNETQIYCPNTGCPWVGEYSKVEDHLDRSNVKPEGNCQYYSVECRQPGCSVVVQRGLLRQHETEECIHRTYTCPHCEQYKSTYINVCREHFSSCKSFPTACPNECSSDTMPRGLLNAHLSNDCPREEVACEYCPVGCHVRKRREKLQSHYEINAHYHNTLLLKELVTVKKTMEERTHKLEEECRNLREKNKQLSSEIALLKVESSSVYEELEEKICKKEETVVAKLAEGVGQNPPVTSPSAGAAPSAVPEVRRGSAENHSEPSVQQENGVSLGEAVQQIKEDIRYIEKWISPTPPFFFTCGKFEAHRKNGTAFMSMPFYTRVRGYKMCIRVDPGGYHQVGVYCCLMRGEHDDYLKWPFRGVIHIKLQNHLGDHDHYCQSIRYDETVSDNQAGRVQTGDKNYLQGYPKFISLDDLKVNLQLNRQYLKGDALDFEVTKVEEL